MPPPHTFCLWWRLLNLTSQQRKISKNYRVWGSAYITEAFHTYPQITMSSWWSLPSTMRLSVFLTPFIVLLQDFVPPTVAQERTLRFVTLVHGMMGLSLVHESQNPGDRFVEGHTGTRIHGFFRGVWRLMGHRKRDFSFIERGLLDILSSALTFSWWVAYWVLRGTTILYCIL